MVSDDYSDRISADWLWRERELRSVDVRLLKMEDVDVKSAIMITYSHWEGHFKSCALELLNFICECVNKKIFKWTDIRPEVRQRLLFCSYRRSSLSGQTQETFISYLNALNDSRFAKALAARDEIVMVDDNLDALRAEAICRNLGLDHDWCALKKVVIDERLLAHRNAVAHGSRRLRSGDLLDLKDPLIVEALKDIRHLIRETKDRFQNAIVGRPFLS